MPALLCLLLLSTPATEPRARTRALADQGTREYVAGHFLTALARFEQAYDLEPLPSLLYNIAQCHRALGQWRLAADFYRRYLDVAPDNSRVQSLLAEAESHLAITGAPVAAPERSASLKLTPAAPAPVDGMSVQPLTSALLQPTPPVGLSPPSNGLRPPATGPAIVLVAGGALLLSGLVLGSVNLAIAGRDHFTPPNQHSLSEGDAQLENTTGALALPVNLVGGAALGAGLAWWLLSPR